MPPPKSKAIRPMSESNVFDEDFRSGSDIDGYASFKDDSAEQEDSKQEENDPLGEDDLGKLEDKPGQFRAALDQEIPQFVNTTDKINVHDINVGRRSYIHRPQFKANVGQLITRPS
ncbi:hypothetical protein HYDPIDRAFT_33959 [Hydnomerulius pinastri MD-312]|uniref:Unplaced genomic scaffold scaffold_84, whole genome shotgun sequence n=1 Tax=Hydnomerulius pinastri MD-312 TaxID=994086 RepID=A0A0C9W800_9AGAM|nr:hypothetical protein HYDPIDRAFT_33959 [Hydnomerulius pinastri MD-312]